MKPVVRGLAALSMVSVMLVGCGSSSGGSSSGSGSSSGGSGSGSGSRSGGSGSGDTTPATNGEDKKPVDQIGKDAAAALKAARSVHVAGTSVDGGKQTSFDLKFQGADTKGTVTQDGHTAEIIKVGGQSFLKADRGFYESQGGGAAADLAAGRWVKVPASSAAEFDSLTLQSFADELSSPDAGGGMPTASQGALDGRKVVVVKGTDGTTGYVANTGAPVPRRFEKPGSNGGRLDFTEYGTNFAITPPADAIALSGT
jgi:hypothetical protein